MSGEGATTTVFVETNLGRHLALSVSLSDTVSDLKKKIEAEYPLTYPDIGEVKVDSFQARREGKFFGVLDSVSISAFCEANGTCYVSIEARALGERVDGCRREAEDNLRDGVSNKGESVSALGGALEAGSNQKSDHKKSNRVSIEARALGKHVDGCRREAEDNLRDGVSNKGESVSPLGGALEAGLNQKSDHKKSNRGRKRRNRDKDNDDSGLDAVVSESWVANVVAGALCDVKGGTKSVVEGPSRTASFDISTRSRYKVHQVGVLLEGVDTRGEVVTCEKNESRDEVSNANFSEDVEDASHSSSVVPAKKRRKVDKAKGDVVSIKENRSLVSGNGESISGSQLASKGIRDDPSTRNSTLRHCSNEDAEGVHSLSNVVGHNKKNGKKTTDTAGNDLFKVPAAPVSESMVSDPPIVSKKDCNLGKEGSYNTSILLGNATTSVSNDDQTDNIGKNHYITNKRSDDREEFDQHGKDDRLHSLQSIGVKEDIVMGESVLETGSHKKTKRIVKKGHKRAVEGDASLHETDKNGSKENVAVQIDVTSELVKTPVTIDSGKSSKKPRKSKDKKDVNEAPASGAEHDEGPGINITPSHSLKVANDAVSVDVGNKEDNGSHKDEEIASEMGAVVPSVVLSDGCIVDEVPDSSPLMESTQANIVGAEGKSKKKLKKIKSSGGKEYDQHGKVDRNRSLQSSGVKEDLRCGVENEHETVMGESVLEIGSHKKTKRIVKRGHKRAEEGDASLHETDEKGSEENVAVPIDGTSELFEAPVTVDSGKSSKKPRKSKDKKDVNMALASGVEHTEGPRIDITPSQSLKVVNDDLSVDLGIKEDKGLNKDEKIASEMGVVIPSIVLSDGGVVNKTLDCSLLMEYTQANVVGDEGKPKKKVKKIKSSGAKDVAKLLLEKEKDNPHGLEVSVTNDNDTGSSSGKTKQTDLDDASGARSFTRSKENVAVLIDETSELVKAPVTVSSGTSCKKPRNFKDKKDVNGAPASGTEHTDGPRIDITPSQSLKVVNDALPVVGNKEDKGTRKDEKIASEMGITSIVLSDGGIVHKAPLMESTQANVVGEEGKSKKKVKMIKSSGAKDVAKLLLEKGKDNPQTLELSMSNDNETGSSSGKTKQTDQDDASGVRRLTRSEENVAVPIDETSELVKAPVTAGSGKSSKKPRKSKDKRDVNGVPASGVEHTEGPRINIIPSQSVKVVKDGPSVEVGNEEDKGTHKDEKIASETGIPSVVLSPGGIVHKAPDSSPLMESSQANILGEKGTSKKKLKKIKSSGAKDVAKLPLEKGQDNPQAQESSKSNDKDMGFSSKKTKQTDQDDASSVRRLTKSKSRRGSVEDNPPEACDKNEASKDLKGSSSSNGINFREYFGCSQGRENIVSSEATAGATDEAKQIDSKTNGDKMENAHPSINSTNQLSRKEDSVEGGPKKISANNGGETVNSSGPEKRLHEKPVAFSEDNKDGSSTSEDGPSFSDASTRTPSDYSLSSDYSDGGSNTVTSLNIGSTKDGGKKSKKAVMSAMSLSEILRSSRSYKKAKISASQTLLEDMDSVDVVPDSCPGL